MTRAKRLRACLVCRNHKNQILLLQFVEPLTKKAYWLPPGGLIEPGELAHFTALREAREEAGIEAHLCSKPSTHAEYDFYWQGQIVPCHTQFFLADLVQELRFSPPTHESFIVARNWFNPNQAIEELKDFGAIMKAVTNLLAP